jgi:hypothetical protein
VAAPDGGFVVAGNYRKDGLLLPLEDDATELTLESIADMFVAGMSSDGSLEWLRTATAEYGINPQEMDITADGNVLVAGGYRGQAIFGGGDPDEIALEPVEIPEPGFVLSIGFDGQLDAAVTTPPFTSGFAALDDGSFVVAYRYEETMIFGEGQPNETVLTSSGEWDVFVARYDASAELVWATSAGGPNDDAVQVAALFPDGTVTVAGTICDDAVFGQGEPNETSLPAAGAYSPFVARYGPSGELLWAKRPLDPVVSDIGGIRAWNGDQILLAGECGNGPYFDASVMCYSEAGEACWSFTSVGEDPARAKAIGLVPDGSTGSLFVGGDYCGNNLLGLDWPGATTLQAKDDDAGDGDVFLVKLVP